MFLLFEEFVKLPSSQSGVSENSDSEIYSDDFWEDPNDESYQPSDSDLSQSQNTSVKVESDSDTFSEDQNIKVRYQKAFHVMTYIFIQVDWNEDDTIKSSLFC